MTIVVTYKGKIWDVGFKRLFNKAVKDSMLEIVKMGEKVAIKNYKSKRQTNDPPVSGSKIIASFVVKSISSNFTGVVFAGGPQSEAPYAIYVDQPRKGFSGYFFMEAGAKAATKMAANSMVKHIEKNFS